MPVDTHDTTAALSQLATDIVDIIKGYEVMEKRADGDLRPIASASTPCTRPMPRSS